MTTETKKPIKTFKLGQVRVSIWENVNATGGEYCSARFERSYRDREGNWHNTQSFVLKDILNLIQLAAQAAWFISVTLPGQRKENAKWADICEPEDL